MLKATMRIFIRTDRATHGKHPIVIKIYTKGKNKYITIPYKVKQNEWNEEKERTKYNPTINTYLDLISAKFNRTLMESSYINDVESLSFAIFERSVSINIGLLDYANYYLDNKKLKNDVKPKTISRYTRMISVLKAFLISIHKPSLLLSDTNLETINLWDTYIKNTLTIKNRPLETNTFNKYHSLLRTLLIQAFNEGKLKLNPYNLYKLKSKPTYRCFLTELELFTLKKLSFESDRDEKVRLIYLFSCFTGIRFNDAQQLSKNNLIRTADSKVYLSFNSLKSSKQQELPLLNDAVAIIDQITNKFTLELAISGKLLPKLSNQKFNDYLKIVAIKAGINKQLTHHTARHTYATFMLSSGVAPQALQTLLGHSNLRETMLYAKITPNYLMQELSKGNQHLKNIK